MRVNKQTNKRKKNEKERGNGRVEKKTGAGAIREVGAKKNKH